MVKIVIGSMAYICMYICINGFGVLIAVLLNRLWSCPQKSARRLDLDEAIEHGSGPNGIERTEWNKTNERANNPFGLIEIDW